MARVRASDSMSEGCSTKSWVDTGMPGNGSATTRVARVSVSSPAEKDCETTVRGTVNGASLGRTDRKTAEATSLAPASTACFSSHRDTVYEVSPCDISKRGPRGSSRGIHLSGVNCSRIEWAAAIMRRYTVSTLPMYPHLRAITLCRKGVSDPFARVDHNRYHTVD